MERALGVCRKKIIPPTTLIITLRAIRPGNRNKQKNKKHLAIDPK
jgi:hypothetical protein